MNVELKIDPELRDLLPPLTNDEYKQLEKNIVENGFDKNFPIMEWHGFIVDGHNRYSICKKHDIKFVIGTLGYETKDEVMEWMLDIQLGRRNLSPIQRIAVAEKYRPIYEKQAQKNLEEGRLKGGLASPNSSTPKIVESYSVKRTENETNAKLAKIAGVGKETYRQAKKILDSNNKELKNKVLSGDKSISAAYKDLTSPKNDSKAENSKETANSTTIQTTKSEIDDEVRKICEDLKVPRTPEYLESIWDYKLNIIECMNADFESFFTAFVSTLGDMDGHVTSDQLNECIENAQKMIVKMENVLEEAKNCIKIKSEEN